MVALYLNDPGTKAVLKQYKLEPKDRIGRGFFAAVYDRGQDRVAKLTCDPSCRDLLGMYARGPHFPKLLETHGAVGDQHRLDLPLYLLEVERLNKVASADLPTKRLARKIEQLSGWKSDPFEYLAECPDLPLSIREAFGCIARLFGDYDGGLAPDIHGANFMVRGKDELILNDLVCHGKILRKSRGLV